MIKSPPRFFCKSRSNSYFSYIRDVAQTVVKFIKNIYSVNNWIHVGLGLNEKNYTGPSMNLLFGYDLKLVLSSMDLFI